MFLKKKLLREISGKKIFITGDIRYNDGQKTPGLRLQNTVYALIAVNSGVYYSRTFLKRWEKNRVKNAEKPAVFSAKKRENRVLF